MKNNILILFAVIASVSSLNPAVVTAEKDEFGHPSTREAQFQNQTPKEEVWGEIRHYTDHHITLKTGQKFNFSKHVLIDVESLSKDDRGNVRIMLDDAGNAQEILFNGIDMPEVIRFKR